MQDLIFIKIGQNQNTAAQNRHDFFRRERSSGVSSTLYFSEKGVALVFKILCQSKLSGTQISLRDDLAIKRIEVELMT